MNRPKIDFTLISEGAPFYALEVTSERRASDDMIAEMVLDVAACRWDEDLPTPSKGSTRHAGGLIIPVNKARSRARRKRVTTRLRKWLDESEGQGLARAA
jgi:hypothetical protein